MSLLIRNARLNREPTDLYIEDEVFSEIGPDLDRDAERIIDAGGMAVLPSFNNAHTHAAMTLMRGYADDLALHEWLEQHIWPYEKNISEETVYHGARLACLEMIKSGTTFFNDMYWFFHGTARAVEEMGMRATLSAPLIDLFDERSAEEYKRGMIGLCGESRRYSERIGFALGPHAIYTVSEESLRWCAEFAAEHDLLVHIHLAETKKEVDDCLAEHGLSPVRYLERIGLLGPNLLAVHLIWVDAEERDMLAENGVKAVHCPKSNMKLASGKFAYSEFADSGMQIAVASDGCASNNNLDMGEELQFAALYEKSHRRLPTALPAEDCFRLGTSAPADMFSLNSGRIEVGRSADCILVDLDDVRLVPGYNLISDMIYSADSSCIDSTICCGKVLMRKRRVDGEEEIVAAARRAGHDLARKLLD